MYKSWCDVCVQDTQCFLDPVKGMIKMYTYAEYGYFYNRKPLQITIATGTALRQYVLPVLLGGLTYPLSI